MDKGFINETARYILSIIRSGGLVTWSWGPDNFRATVYRNMAALRFGVSGFIHKGDVVVAYNRGADVFEVYCIDGYEVVVSSRNEVYFDELIGGIDELVEKNCSDKEYKNRRRKWLAENPLKLQ